MKEPQPVPDPCSLFVAPIDDAPHQVAGRVQLRRSHTERAPIAVTNFSTASTVSMHASRFLRIIPAWPPVATLSVLWSWMS
jgi:hypothetical protein